MMSHIFGAVAIPLPQVNQLQRASESDAEKQPNLMQIHPHRHEIPLFLSITVGL